MLLTLALAAVLAAPPADKAPRPLPLLAKEPKVDGDLKDLAGAQAFKSPPSAKSGSAKLEVKAGFKKDTLYVGVSVNDDKVLAADSLDVTLFFPESGTTSRGFVYRLGSQGLQPSPEGLGAPEFAFKLVKAATKEVKGGFDVELAIPGRALPRFQGSKPLTLSVCVDYADVDAEGGEPIKLSTCPTGEMVGGPTRLPDELRKALQLTPAADVEGVEARERGWVGYSKLHYPTWVQGFEPMTEELLSDLVAGDTAVPPASVSLPAVRLVLPDNRPIITLVTGKNPYVKSTCVPGNELRMAMYVTQGTTAARVLEWPAATCNLGRAMRVELSAEGALEIGYTGGATHHFTWTTDHFERSELGAR